MNTKRWLLASAAMFVAISVVGYVLHEVLLSDLYKQTAAVWRPDMKNIMWMMWISSAIYALMFVFIYDRGYEKEKPGLAQGLRYGLYLWLLTSVPMTIGWYVVLPIPLVLAVYWVIGGLVESLIGGAVVGLVYKR